MFLQVLEVSLYILEVVECVDVSIASVGDVTTCVRDASISVGSLEDVTTCVGYVCTCTGDCLMA